MHTRIYALHKVNPSSAYADKVELVEIFLSYTDLLDYAWRELDVLFDKEAGMSDTDAEGTYYFSEKCTAHIPGHIP